MTSFMESEAFRLAGKKVKLSEIHTVYYEYLERARDFLRTRGATALGEGSEADALQRIWRGYGIVPLEAYPGVLAADGRHDHSKLFERIENYLGYVKENGYWDEAETLAVLRVYLDEFLGRPPERFDYDGGTWTPRTFMTDYLKIDPEAYVSVMSTMRSPFWTQAELDAPDNWRRSADYYNVPLDAFMGLLKTAVAGGYSACIGGDVSESGYYGFEDVAVVPSFDIPAALIDQGARELRIYNDTTQDDHGIHLVGHTRVGAHDWYLIKDSGRSARWGKLEGYYMYRDDYIKLKMLTLTFHKDVLRDLLPSFAAPAAAKGGAAR
jgi:bleomycin hydrolase